MCFDLRINRFGEVAERSNAHAWRACDPQGFQGSNPCLSVVLFESYWEISSYDATSLDVGGCVCFCMEALASFCH